MVVYTFNSSTVIWEAGEGGLQILAQYQSQKLLMVSTYLTQTFFWPFYLMEGLLYFSSLFISRIIIFL